MGQLSNLVAKRETVYKTMRAHEYHLSRQYTDVSRNGYADDIEIEK